MKITDLILNETINLNLQATSKEEVIKELSEMLVESGRITNFKKFVKAVLSREKEGTTGVGDGIAIPHAKSKYVLEPTLVFGISKNGVDFDSMDGELTHIFFLIAVPESSVTIHLDTLSRLARMLIYEDFRLGLMSSQTDDDVINLINQKQSKGGQYD